MNKSVWIFGAGEDGSFLFDCLHKFSDLYVGGFIDNSPIKQGSIYREKIVVSINEWLGQRDGSIILIGIGQEHYYEIVTQMQRLGLEQGRDFFDGKLYLQKYLLSEKGNLFVYMSQICVTERCTLKCKKCAHGCQNVPMDSSDMDVEIAKRSVDWFFRYVDCCNEFAIIGGETLLYKNLNEIVSYVGERYLNRINVLSITTNGTIPVSDKLISTSKKYNVFWRISNYAEALPKLKKNYDELKELLDDNSISYKFGSISGVWLDYGFGEVDHGADTTALKKIFAKCKLGCHEIRDSKLFYCVMARAVSDNMRIGGYVNDYLDLNDLEEKEAKKRIVEFVNGNCKKGYLDMCRYCRGAESFNYPIPIAEQV